MVGGSLRDTLASSITKTGRHDIAESGVMHKKKTGNTKWRLTPITLV